MKYIKVILPIIIFIISIIYSYNTFYYVNKNIIHVNNITNVPSNTIPMEDEVKKRINELYSINQDTIGYLIIPDTVVNYPLMYNGTDFYLSHNIYKNSSSLGELYIDKNNTLEDDNLFIYGHNMKNGSMFHELINYKNESYYKEHKYIYLYINNEKRIYEVVSTIISPVYNKEDKVFKFYKYYNFTNEEEFNYYKSNILKMSFYNTNVDIKYGDDLLTLVTCEYTYSDGRLAVILKRVDNHE